MIRGALAALLVWAPCLSAQQLPCQSECEPLVRETISWVIEKYDLAPADLVIDSVLSGHGPAAAGNRLMIPKAVFEGIAATSEVMLDERGSVLDCTVPIPIPPGRTCRFLRGSAFATIRVYELGHGMPVVLRVSVTVVNPERGLSYMEAYRLKLEPGPAGWRVVDSQLVLVSS